MSSDFTTLPGGMKVLATTPEEEGGQVLNDNFTNIDSFIANRADYVDATFMFVGSLTPPVTDATNHLILTRSGTFVDVFAVAKTVGAASKVFVIKLNGTALTTVTLTTANSVSHTTFSTTTFSAGDKLSIDLSSGDGADVTVQLSLKYTS